MTIDKFRGWLEVIGIFGVIASLVFVGIQISQDQHIAKADMYQARSEMLSQAMASAAANTEAVAAWAKGSYGDPDQEILSDGLKAPLSAYEYMLVSFQIRSILALVDNSFHQYQEGFLPEEHWIGVRSTVKNFAAENVFYRHELRANLVNMYPALREEMQRILDEIDRGSSE